MSKTKQFATTELLKKAPGYIAAEGLFRQAENDRRIGWDYATAVAATGCRPYEDDNEKIPNLLMDPNAIARIIAKTTEEFAPLFTREALPKADEDQVLAAGRAFEALVPAYLDLKVYGTKKVATNYANAKSAFVEAFANARDAGSPSADTREGAVDVANAMVTDIEKAMDRRFITMCTNIVNAAQGR